MVDPTPLPAEHTPAYPVADLDTCATEPIHVPGAIQPYGVLLAIDPADRTVVVASANTEDMLGIPAEKAVGTTLADVIGEQAAETIARRVAEETLAEPMILTLPVAGSLGGLDLDVSVHWSGERVVIEIEELGRPRSVLLSYQSARGAMARISDHDDVLGLTDRLAREIRTLTDFDRVMVYRFDTEWNGEVVAEAKRDDLNPFLGLRYPATDIPAQARRLYTISWTRLIADVGYRPVPLEPVLDPTTGRALDLSHSVLRSVSPIHLEYLQNMGVSASMSVSLVQDGRLWGLVACHHYAGPHRPSQDARAAAEFLAQVAAHRIAQIESAEQRQRALDTRATLATVQERLARAHQPVATALVEDPDLNALMGASGVAAYVDGELHVHGTVPGPAVLRRIAERFGRGRADDVLVMTDALHHQLGAGSGIDVHRDLADAAGALFVGRPGERWVLWLRPELRQVVAWGGDPGNAKLARLEGDTVRLSPRLSFERWQQEVRGRSETWGDHHELAARGVVRLLDSLVLKHARDQVAVAEALQRSVVASWTSRVEGIDVAVRYQPATTYELGGDWWDFVDLGAGRVAFVVGDVAGHGVEAVAAMTQIRSALRAYLTAGIDVNRSLDHLDRFVAELSHQVASAVVVVVDPSRGHVEVSVAGHPPPLLFGPGVAADEELAGRPVLGINAGQAIGHRVVVAPGTTLLLFTDGLVERRGTDLNQNIARLRRRAGDGPGDDDLDDWLGRLIATAPAGDDDMTAVAIRVL